MGRRIAVLVCALMLVAGAMAVSESVTVADPTNNFPCTGFDSTSAGFYSFQKLGVTSPNTAEFAFTDGGVAYTAKATLFVCGLQSSTPVCTLANPPTGNSTTVIGVLAVTDTRDSSVQCFPLSNPNNAKTGFSIVSDNSTKSNSFGWVVNANNNVDAQVKYVPTLQMECTDDNTVTASLSAISSNSVTVNLGAKSYCSYNAGRFVAFMFQHKLFPIILLPISILFIFFGQKFIKVILFKIGFVFALLISLATALTLKPLDSWNTKSVWIVAVCALLVSIVVGYLVAKMTKLYFMVAGGFLGYMVSMKTFELVVLITSKSSDTVQVITTVSCIILGVVVGLCIHDHVLILSTAFGGSYLFTFSVGLLLKNYPDMDNLPNFKSLNFKDQLVKWFFIYTIGWLLIGILGSYVQYKARAARNKRKEEGDANDEDKSYFEHIEEAGGFYNMNTGYYQAARPKNQYI